MFQIVLPRLDLSLYTIALSPVLLRVSPTAFSRQTSPM